MSHHGHSHGEIDGLTGELICDGGHAPDGLLHLRIASIFVIFIGSSLGSLFPIIAKRSSWLNVPKPLFDFAKYFGSGVIIATAFIHLLGHALSAFESECVPAAWQEYPYALAFCLLSIFFIFITELVAFRWGTSKLAKLGVGHDTHGHNLGSHAAHGPEATFSAEVKPDNQSDDTEKRTTPITDNAALTQIIGIAILEFGVALHSILIGLTLAVDEQFKILFVVLVFHQTFEGLAIGSRLAFMQLPSRFNWVPIAGAVLYGLTTPIGIAVGLSAASTYNPGGTTASLVSGILDSLSAGILFYTGLVELLAHEFLFNKEMMSASSGQIIYAVGSMMLGCALMALLGKWA